MKSHNIILYGPPGTGKTYQTSALAVQLIENLSPSDFRQEYPMTARTQLREQAERYRQAGRMAMVIFHPSFSYEDFVEGIKPQSNEQKLLYEVADGIFKQICIRAAHALYLAQQQHTLTATATTRHDFDALFFEFIDYLQRTAADDTQETVFESKTGKPFYLTDINKNSTLSLRMGKGKKAYAVTKGTLAKLYRTFDSAQDIKNLRRDLPASARGGGSVTWAVFNRLKEYEATRNQTYRFLLTGNSPYDAAQYQAMKRDVAHLDYASLTTEDYAQAGTFVLIIDEINRGNVAAIFGELIALLEDDKRAGQPEALRTVLPYSREPFSVPPNLFLVGTMNTADRSVEALDTALRRRFSFVAVPPTPALLASVEVTVRPSSAVRSSPSALSLAAEREGEYRKPEATPTTYIIHLEKLLRTINRRLTALLDAEHQIGHGYLMPVMEADHPLDTLREVFYRKIIPLLQEYFFNTTEKVILVVGNNFFTPSDLPETSGNFFAIPDPSDQWPEASAYQRSYEIRSLSDEEFVNAVRHVYAPS